MSIPALSEQNIMDALNFIDEHGTPNHNQSMTYELVTEDGKNYPPKYVIAVAAHIANGVEISTDGFNSVEAKDYLQKLGFHIETKQEKFQITISADSIVSTDRRFTMDNLSLGDSYKPLDAYFQSASGDKIKRNYRKGERRNSNQTLPRIAFQVFEKQLSALSVEEKETFPICKYNPNSDLICGIYPRVPEFKKHRNTLEYLTYSYDNGRQFVIYGWNIFSTLLFVQECLKRFGGQGDQFVLIYREKGENEITASENETVVQEELKKYVFIIDEINRGEISKIFGELFFSVDPGYRGKAGEVSTQYANLHADPDEKFFIPENVYIIGTMNDIDRSVDSFDFAMRRRFRFVELKADEHLEMLASLEDEELENEAIRRMAALNKEIANVEDLNENYQIGAAYFLKLKTLTFDQLWTDYLEPLLREYVQGMYDETGIMGRFAKAYGYKKSFEDSDDELAQN